MIEFNKGDVLVIGAHSSEKGKGLAYSRGIVVAQENGVSGGWDVYDVADKYTGAEFSIYGFSVECRIEPKPTVKSYDVVLHGIMASDYFQGCGVCGTKYESVYTGIGSTVQTALDDAFEQMAAMWGISAIEKKITAEYADKKFETVPQEREESYWFVSIRVSSEEA